MRELRIGRKRCGARKRPATGWQALTPSELEAVRLASEGLTNPEIGQRLFISRRTVQTHLAHAFRKLESPRGSNLPRKRAGAAASEAVDAFTECLLWRLLSLAMPDDPKTSLSVQKGGARSP